MITGAAGTVVVDCDDTWAGGVAGVLAQRRVQRWALPAVRCGDPAADETVPNLVVAKGCADGKVAVYNNAGATHVVFDAVGWYA